jgi:hypothetical protein
MCRAKIALQGQPYQPELNSAREGDLFVELHPAPPRHGICMRVGSPEEGWKLLKTLLFYEETLEQQGLVDAKHNIGCLIVRTDNDWDDWRSVKGEDLDSYMLRRYGQRALDGLTPL